MLWIVAIVCLLPLIARSVVGAADDAPVTETTGCSTGTVARVATITGRLSKIVIPEVNYKDASLEEIAGDLTRQSAKLSPDGVGVTIVVLTNRPNCEVLIPAGLDEEVVGEIRKIQRRCYPDYFTADWAGAPKRRITLSLRNIPLIEVLQYISVVGGTGWYVNSRGVMLGRPALQLEARVYYIHLPDQEFAKMAKMRVFEEPGNREIPIKLIESGGRQLIIAVNTPDNLDVLDRFVRDLNPTYPNNH